MTQASIYFKQIEIGPMANYVYLIGDPVTKQAALVDPAWDIPAIIDIAKKDGYQITHALVTHGHPDHVNGVEELMNLTNAPVYMHKDEMPWFGQWKSSCVQTQSGDTVRVGQVEIALIHTPGHTPGSQCFLVNHRLISGDTLFIGGCGRTDFPGGDAAQLYDSLTNKLSKLNDQVVLCPGHNYAEESFSTIGHEKLTNPYLQFQNVNEFVAKR